MKRVYVGALGALLAALSGYPVHAEPQVDMTEHQEYKAWMDHVLGQYDLGWKTETSTISGEQCTSDDFNDQMLNPMWDAVAYNDITIEEVGGAVKISGQVPGYAPSYSGGSVALHDPIPVQSFNAQVDVLASVGTFGGALHRGRHFGFFASGDNGHYVGIQYWAGAYRISWNNGGGWERIYAAANGDEMTNWYTWKIVYDAATQRASVYVDDRQIGATVTVNLGSTFRPHFDLVAPANVWIEGFWDNFSVCFEATDTTPPAITLESVSPQVLWPPNGKMVDVVIAGHAEDDDSGIASVTIDVVDEYGEIEATRAGFGPIALKAWRKGNDSDGRTYNVRITAVDNAGNTAVTKLQVVVPHDVGMP